MKGESSGSARAEATPPPPAPDAGDPGPMDADGYGFAAPRSVEGFQIPLPLRIYRRQPIGWLDRPAATNAPRPGRRGRAAGFA